VLWEGLYTYVVFFITMEEKISPEKADELIARLFFNLDGSPKSIVIQKPEKKVWTEDFNKVIIELTKQGYLVKKKIPLPCSRCGGSGKYSWNRITGTVCFKCNGRKIFYIDQEEN